MSRPAALSLLLVAGGLALVTVVPAGQATGAAHSRVALHAVTPLGTVAQHVATGEPTPTPQGPCGPGSLPEPGLQGRVPAATSEGYRCNVEVLGTAGKSGGFKVERYVDAAGHECAFYDTTLLFPSNAVNLAEELTGVAVLDMSDPANPVRTTTLVTPAMQSPHESLLLNKKRGLLAAVAGNAVFAPGPRALRPAPPTRSRRRPAPRPDRDASAGRPGARRSPARPLRSAPSARPAAASRARRSPGRP